MCRHSISDAFWLLLNLAPMAPFHAQGDLIVDVAFGEKVAGLKGVDDLSKPLILIDT